MNPFEQQAPIPGIKHIIAIGSGKGGVGKSTVTVNLAMALSRIGKKVGILDSDLYGPSLPRMMGSLNQKPEMNEDQKIIPLVRYGIKLMSIGYLVEEDQALIWRGPMLFKAIQQFFGDVAWGELDVLLIDLPPGTGDIVLTIAQKVPVSGGIVVSTPQNISLADAKKAFDLFEKVNVPRLGLIENMSTLEIEGQEPVALFPRGQVDAFLETHALEHLGAIPFQPSIGLACEAGIPVVESESGSPVAKTFEKVAKRVMERLES